MSKFGGLVVDHLVDPPSVQDILGCQCHLRWKPLSKGPGFHPKHPLRKGLRLGEKDAKSLVGAHVVFDVFISTPVQSAVSRLARTIARRFSTFHRSVPEGCQWLSNPGTSHWEGVWKAPVAPDVVQKNLNSKLRPNSELRSGQAECRMPNRSESPASSRSHALRATMSHALTMRVPPWCVRNGPRCEKLVGASNVWSVTAGSRST